MKMTRKETYKIIDERLKDFSKPSLSCSSSAICFTSTGNQLPEESSVIDGIPCGKIKAIGQNCCKQDLCCQCQEKMGRKMTAHYVSLKDVLDTPVGEESLPGYLRK